MAEDNNRHFQTMGTLTLTSGFRERRRGQWFALIIGHGGDLVPVIGKAMDHLFIRHNSTNAATIAPSPTRP